MSVLRRQMFQQGGPVTAPEAAAVQQGAQQVMGQINQEIDTSQNFEQMINATRGEAAPIEDRYRELATIVGPEDAMQTPESVLALAQPVIENALVDEGIGGLAQEQMSGPVGPEMSGGIMEMTQPVQQFQKGGAALSDYYQANLPLIQEILGSEDVKKQAQGQALLDIAQRAFLFGSGVNPATGKPYGEDETEAQKLAGFLASATTPIGEQLSVYNQAKAAERSKALDMAITQKAAAGKEKKVELLNVMSAEGTVLASLNKNDAKFEENFNKLKELNSGAYLAKLPTGALTKASVAQEMDQVFVDGAFQGFINIKDPNVNKLITKLKTENPTKTIQVLDKPPPPFTPVVTFNDDGKAAVSISNSQLSSNLSLGFTEENNPKPSKFLSEKVIMYNNKGQAGIATTDAELQRLIKTHPNQNKPTAFTSKRLWKISEDGIIQSESKVATNIGEQATLIQSGFSSETPPEFYEEKVVWKNDKDFKVVKSQGEYSTALDDGYVFENKQEPYEAKIYFNQKGKHVVSKSNEELEANFNEGFIYPTKLTPFKPIVLFNEDGKKAVVENFENVAKVMKKGFVLENKPDPYPMTVLFNNDGEVKIATSKKVHEQALKDGFLHDSIQKPGAPAIHDVFNDQDTFVGSYDLNNVEDLKRFNTLKELPNYRVYKTGVRPKTPDVTPNLKVVRYIGDHPLKGTSGNFDANSEDGKQIIEFATANPDQAQLFNLKTEDQPKETQTAYYVEMDGAGQIVVSNDAGKTFTKNGQVYQLSDYKNEVSGFPLNSRNTFEVFQKLKISKQAKQQLEELDFEIMSQIGMSAADAAALTNALDQVRQGTGFYAQVQRLINSGSSIIPQTIRGKPWFEDKQQANNYVKSVNLLVRSALTLSPRYAVYDLKLVQEVLPDTNSFLTTPTTEANKLINVKQLLFEQKTKNLKFLQEGGLTTSDTNLLRSKNLEISRALELLSGVPLYGNKIKQHYTSDFMKELKEKSKKILDKTKGKI